MRLWSLHPRYLDAKGLVALWREALLARAVLRGETTGYRHHPQLQRFTEHPTPRTALNAYLKAIVSEAQARGYAFSRGKVGPRRGRVVLTVTRGQLEYEWRHLMRKLRVRSPGLHARWRRLATPAAHPLFRIVPGAIAGWERTLSTPGARAHDSRKEPRRSGGRRR
jgi:pyrimidine dimer DNA glycosylase